MTSIQSIQGVGPKSPFEGQTVQVTGIVTASDKRGFFIQEAATDLKLGSPGIYVFGGKGQVSVGDQVELSGRVAEFSRPPRNNAPPSFTTQVKLQGAVVIRSSNNPLPAVVIGEGGVRPTDFQSWENLESARVQINDALVVGPPNHIPNFADMYLAADGGKGITQRTASGGILRTSPEANQAIGARMPIDALPMLNVGARFKDAVFGTVVERHGHHQVTVWDPQAEQVIPSPITLGRSRLAEQYKNDKNVLITGSLNCENSDLQHEDIALVQNWDRALVDDDVGDGRIDRIAQRIDLMGTPHIMSLQEIQDNDGAELSETVDGSSTWEGLIDAIEKRTGTRYKWVDRPPVNGKEGGMPGGNIRNGFLYDPSRVQLVEESVRRIQDPSFEGTRLPLEATFLFKHEGVTEKITMMTVHNKSKRSGPATEEVRQAQAAVLNREAKAALTSDVHSHRSIQGDRNAYEDEEPLKIETKDGALVSLIETVPATERFSSTYGGTLGALDHITAKTNAEVQMEYVHFNAEFDNRMRSGDHDGEVMIWKFKKPAATNPTP